MFLSPEAEPIAKDFGGGKDAQPQYVLTPPMNIMQIMSLQ